MPRLRYLTRSVNNLKSIRRYIKEKSGSREIAQNYITKLREQCRRLASHPGEVGVAQPELGEGFRSFPHGNYIIFFKYNGSYLDIVMITEGHRNMPALFNTGEPS